MATTTQRTTHTATTDWTDLVTSIAGAASVGGEIRTYGRIEVIKGGGSAPAANAKGIRVEPGGSEWCEAVNIWVRTLEGSCTVLFETI